MAVNIETLKTRSLTALFFVLIMLAGLLINGWLFAILFVIIMFGSLFEFFKLIKKIPVFSDSKYGVLGLPYIILPVLLIIYLAFGKSFNPSNFSPVIPCVVIFSIWINDTMAYLVGSLIGKTPFSKISPKKTWEGTIGGAILCVLVMGLLAYFLINSNPSFYTISTKDVIIISAICAVFGTLGDLFESKLKRMAGVKDSGNFMPGHGGFLDRFDSFLIATPFVWIYIQYLM